MTDPTPYPFQPPGAAWLAEHPRSMLADEMGLGKTITAILACRRVNAARVLVVCPSVVLFNWSREFDRWAPEYHDTHDMIASKTATLQHNESPTQVAIVTHGLSMLPAIRAQLFAQTWDAVILDEGHMFRSPTALRTIGFYGLQNVPALVSRARHAWVLTGTPAPNSCVELWPALYGLQPERLKHNGRVMSYETFRDRFCVTRATRYSSEPKVIGNKPEMLPELRRRLRGFYLRRLAKDHLPDLPPIRFEEIALTPSSGSLGVREAEKHLPHFEFTPEDLQDLEENVEFAAWRRACGLAKVLPAAELLCSELDAPGGVDKLVVFAHHKDVVGGLQHEFEREGHGCVAITGATSAKDRDAAVQAFENDPSIRVAACNIVAGGVGTTMVAARDVVLVEMSYVPGENAQAVKRVHRIGQRHHVRARVLSLAGSIDEAVCTALRRKTQGLREVFDA